MKLSLCIVTACATKLIAAQRIPPTPSGIEHINDSFKSLFRNTSLGSQVKYTLASTFDSGCGLKESTAQEWADNKAAITNFTQTNFRNFVNTGGNDSFVNYLRDRYAKKAILSCDAVGNAGNCTIGSCLNLDDDVPKEERQIAYLVFEQISGYAQVMQGLPDATRTASDYIWNTSDSIFELFFHHEYRRGTGYEASGKGGGYVYDKAQAKSWWDGEVMSIIRKRTHRRATVDDDFGLFMKGLPNRNGATIVDAMTTMPFLSPGPDLMESVVNMEKKWLYAAAVNRIWWAFNRPYIVDTDAPMGCIYDGRGHYDYRICLPEYPYRSFWLWAIGSYLEFDKPGSSRPLNHAQAHVSGPWTFRFFNKYHDKPHKLSNDPEVNLFGTITQQDMLRSSLFVHRHQLADDYDNSNITTTGGAFHYADLTFGDDAELGWTGVQGAWSVPICRNPNGEAITSVHRRTSRNYPCMCGEFSWNGGWTFEEDETMRFLELSRFQFSKDWRTVCREASCHRDKEIDMKAIFQAKLGPPQDKDIPEKLRGPFKECRHPKSHKFKGNPDHDFNYGINSNT
jgi:hypothetical protein